MSWKIRVTFTTRTTPRGWVSPDIRIERPGWGEQVFPFLIERIQIEIEEHRLVLSGMERYNFFVEALSVIGSGHAGGRVIPQAFHFLGKFPRQELVSEWTIFPGVGVKPRHEYKTWGREYHNMPTTGWKPGKIGPEVVSRLFPIASLICSR